MDKKTIDSYNKAAKDYNVETIDFWERFPKTFINKFAESVKKSGKILDAGSGSGRDALIFKKAGFDVVCIDASESMINICKKKGLNAIVGDFLKLPFLNSNFDGVWAYTSLLHIEKNKIKLALNEIYRVLKKDGVFALGMIEGEKEEYRTSLGPDMLRYFSYYKKDEMEELIKECGFEVLYFEQFKPGPKNYLNFISRKAVI